MSICKEHPNWLNSKVMSVLELMSHKIEPAPSRETHEARNKRMEWWHAAHLSMFIHFGLYSGLAGEYKGGPILQKAAEWY